MSTEEQVSPLDISFSNEKGFEPSTPSQTSPPAKQKQNYPSMLIRNPFEIFEVSSRRETQTRTFTPQAKPTHQVQRYFSRMKEIKKKETSIFMSRSFIHQLQISRQRIRKQERWQSMHLNHMREISRLDNLLNRVQKNINLYSRLYPKKRY